MAEKKGDPPHTTHRVVTTNLHTFSWLLLISYHLKKKKNRNGYSKTHTSVTRKKKASSMRQREYARHPHAERLPIKAKMRK
jgi:hypothetical protein